MENSFKKLEEPAKIPSKDLKKGVVKNITSIKLFSDLFDLFINDFGNIAQSVFKKSNFS